MTTIAALHKPGWGTAIGSDRMVSNGAYKTYLVDGKWVRHGDWAVGVAGSLRTLVLVQEHADELFDELASPFEFGQRVIAMFEAFGYTGDQEMGPKAYGSAMLLACPAGLWDFDGTVTPIPAPANTLIAAGSGDAYAIGAGFGMGEGGDPLRRVARGVAAGIAFDPSSGGEVWIGALRRRKSRDAG